MKLNLCILALLCLFINTHGQAPAQTLSVGDQVPDLTVYSILNHPKGQTKLSAYNGKLLILDFWATWCGPCISLFPKTDSLQRAFKDQVQFLPVTYEPQDKVEKLFNKLTSLNGISLPLVVQDEALHKLFPHKKLPHYVWIDRNGKVIAITEADAVSAENIQRMLNGQPRALATKKDVVIPFSKEEPLLIGSNGGGAEHLKYHRLLAGYIEGITGGYTIFKADSVQGGRIQATNVPLPWLWQLAHSNGTKNFGYNQMVFEVRDKAPLLNSSGGNAYEAWLKAGNGFCYEVVVPKFFKGSLFKLMQEDLVLFFPQYKTSVELVQRPCLALVRTSDADNIKSKGGKSSFFFDATGCELHNWTLAMLVDQLNTKYLQHLPTPVVNQTGIPYQVDLKLDADMSHVESIRNALHAYGLDLIALQCAMEVIVVRDAN